MLFRSGELRNFTDEEKEEHSDAFAEEYEGKVDQFIAFISDFNFSIIKIFRKAIAFLFLS